MILATVGIIVLLYIIYAPLMEFLCKYLHIGTLWKGPAAIRKVCLTFDDGPDPRYTPQVLDILRDLDVKATFFLVAKRAEQHPELVQRILADGHEVASHGWGHRHAWLLDPISTWRDISRSLISLKRLTGRDMVYYRPPWGAFNFVTRLAASAFNVTPTLWSRRAIDWHPGEHSAEIVDRVVRGAHTGAIILAHDAGGGEGAPLNTIAALPQIIDKLRALGYGFAIVGEMVEAQTSHDKTMHELFGHYPWWRRLLINAWSIVEYGFAKAYRIESVNRIFRVSRTTWNFGPRKNDGGEVLVANGDTMFDLHFQNETLLTFSNAADHRALIRGLRMAKDGFRDIARLLQFDERFKDVQGVSAMTLMNRGMEMLGFHVEDVPETRYKRNLRRYMKFLMAMYHPEGFSRLRQGRRDLDLKLLWMTREEIIKLYG